MISTSLHFPEKINDNNEYTENDDIKNFDPKIKILQFLKILVKNFQKKYTLGNRITIDETLLHFTGKNKMKFYIPMKPKKWGFKLHLLCDADTFYVYNILFDYFDFEDYSKLLAENIVLKLLEVINDNRQRNIYFDGWYSSINLMKKLSSKGYLNTTIFRSNVLYLPSKFKNESKVNA